MKARTQMKLWVGGGILVFLLGFTDLTPTKYGYTSSLFHTGVIMVMFGYLDYYKESRRNEE